MNVSDSITFRILTPEKVPQLADCVRHLADYHNRVKVAREVVYPFYDIPEHLALLRKKVEAGKAVVYALFCEREIVGFVQISFNDKNGDLDYLFLEEKFRKHGYGKRLMDWALAEFARRDVETVHLKVILGNDAQTFYEHCGFQAQALCMVKKMSGDSR